SFGTQLPLMSFLPASTREISVWRSVCVRFDASVTPRAVGALAVVALTFVVEKSTCGGSRPGCSVVNTVRQLPSNFELQPAAVTGGMWSAASNTGVIALIAVRDPLPVSQPAAEHAVNASTSIARKWPVMYGNVKRFRPAEVVALGIDGTGSM